MRQSKWQVIDGAGAQKLETISQDVLKWNRFSPSLEAMEAMAEDLDDRASSTASDLIDAAEDQGNLTNIDAIIERLGPEQKDEIVRAYMAEWVVGRIKSIKKGTGFGYGKLARLTVNEEGVTRRRAFIEPGHQIDLRARRREVVPGTVIEGRIDRFSSAPELGGRLVLHNTVITSFIHGLVDPSDGQPRVELDILAKSS